MFSQFKQLSLEELIQYPAQNCPFIFKNILLDRLSLFHATFQLDQFNYSSLGELNATITNLNLFEIYNLKIERKLMHLNVFEQLQFMHIKGPLRKIETEVFKSLTNLWYIRMQIRNMKGFFQTQGIEWTKHLNLNRTHYFHLEFNLDLYSTDSYPIEYFPFLRYTFPNEDLCIFSAFPHQNLIFPFITGNFLSSTKPNCTIVWLYKHFPLLIKQIGFKKFLKNIQHHKL